MATENVYFEGRIKIAGPNDTGSFSVSTSDGQDLGTAETLAAALQIGRRSLGYDTEAVEVEDDTDIINEE